MKIAIRVLTGIVGLWLIAPTLVVIPMSFTGKASFEFPPSSWSTRWYENFFSDPLWTEALFASLRIAVLVTIIAVTVGTAAALGLARGRIPFRGGVNGALMLPMVMPLVVLGIGIYAVFLNLGLVGTTRGFVAAHTALAIPFVLVAVSASLKTFDIGLERAAASLGAGRLATFRQVTLPIIRPGVLSGALFAFVTSFDEIVIALFISNPETRTLPVQMYTSVTREVDPTIAAASTLTIAVTTALLLCAGLANRRRLRNG